ncbi:MAG: hypothetical protein V9E87_03460 [Gemmatimonadales bacterium]
MPPRQRRILIIVAAAITLLALGYVAWNQRWAISGRAVAIVDPKVRQWAAREVSRLSDGVYQLRASTIVVDEARHRVAIDTITLTTDVAANARRATPLPTVTLRFLGCDLEGIALEQLAARRGLHMRSAGCDSVRLEGEVPAPKAGAAATPIRPGVFLSLRDNLDLPREVPFISIDTIAFPQVSIALGLAGRNRRRTVLSLDRFAVRLDSLHYDPKQPVEERGPLLSRDVSLRLVGFEGNREAATRLSLDSMSASLGRGTFQLDGLVYEPIVGSLGDSLGFQALEVGHLQLRGVDWRAFLTAGDVGVSRLAVDHALLRFPAPGTITAPAAKTAKVAVPVASAAPLTRRTVGSVLRALGRDMRLDTLDMRDLTLIEGAVRRQDSTVTTLERLAVQGAHFDDSTSWTTAFPVGRITVAADHLTRRQGEDQLQVGALRLSVAAGTATIDSLRAGPDGNDAAFRRRHQFRTDRMVLSAARVAVAGMDFPGYLQDGAFRIRRGDATGVELDILTDKRMPPERGKRTSRRYPQQALRDLGLDFGADTLTLAGEARYREHAVAAPAPGVITFRSLRATLLNFTNDPARMSDSTPFRLVADARLMGSGAFHFELEMPLLAEQFSMHYRGRLGAMDAMALNPFASDGAGVKFTRGRIEGISFDATVTSGRARGRISPRWTNLGIELPGLDRKNTGILGGLKRAVGKFVANAFLVRDDNTGGGKTPPRDGTIDHRWSPRETLPQFLWNSIRDPLVPLLKK